MTMADPQAVLPRLGLESDRLCWPWRCQPSVGPDQRLSILSAWCAAIRWIRGIHLTGLDSTVATL